MEQCMDTSLLDAFVDGELSPEETARVRAHLDSCAACRAYVDDALAIRAALGGWEDTPVPEDFDRRVMDAVAAHPRRRPTPWKKALVPLAACLAVLVLALPLRGALMNHSVGAAQSAEDTASLTSQVTEDAASGEEADAAAPASPEEDAVGEAAPAVEAPAAAKAAQEPTAEQFTAQETQTPPSADQSAPAEADSVAPVRNSLTAAQDSGDTPQAYAAAPAMEAADAASAQEREESQQADAPFATLTLTAAQAGNLLDGCPVEDQTQGQTTYRLDTAAYVQLKCALIAAGNLPDTEELSSTPDDGGTPYALVIVTKEP
ncbi:zf-HC2 domain-containing protein [uncultured Oscillibacter sp.]|uniref:zf-HC2 domain-containing protein n=1 Tax=uncultured Oscillibacter sp. TaxID=876091 RepID=UPI0025FEAF90|nr:zf-HC2 domain-containing protein [uncultured Oscillibacter sp.]